MGWVQLTGAGSSPTTYAISEFVFFNREALKLLSILNLFFVFGHGSSHLYSGFGQVCGYCSPTGPRFSQMAMQ